MATSDLIVRFIDGVRTTTTPSVSPDGAHVAAVVAETDLDANRVVRRVWLDGEPLTAGPGDTDPVWSPDGRWLAVVSADPDATDDRYRLRVLPIDRPGEARTVCTSPERIANPTWSPDGASLAYVTRGRDERYDAPDVSWQAPREITHFFARLDGEDWIADRPAHVHVVDAHGSGRARDLTPGPWQHAGVSWLPDGTALVTAAARHDTWDRDLATDLYLVPLDGEPQRLTDGTADLSWPSVSPDGRHVAFIGHDDPLLHPQNARIGVLDLRTNERRWIQGGLDRTTRSFSSGARAPCWVDDASVLAVAEDRGAVHLHRFHLDDRTPERLTDGPLTVQGFDLAAGTLAMAVSRVDHTGSLVLRSLDPGGDERHLGPAPTRGRGWDRSTAPCSDGRGEIDVWVMLPDDPAPSGGYPVLLNVHGGPFAQYGEAWFDEAQLQAAAGYAVVLCNPRGSSGRDSAWGSAINGPKHPTVPGSGWGTVDVDDVLAALDAALARYPLDADRVGMLGGSYGGYMATLLAARHGHRFRAICSERAVNDLLSLEWSSDIATMFRATHGVDIATDPEEYARRSPIRDARDIHVPMLLVHSEQDWRCPINQAEQLWVLLRLLDRDVRFVRFPGEGHELSRAGSPVHRRQRAEILLDFFDQHLRPEVTGS